MKILFIGYDNPNFTNTNFYRKKALMELGHEVVSCNDRGYLLPGRIRKAVAFLQVWDAKRLNRSFVRSAMKFNPALCIVTGGYHVQAEALQKMKDMGIKLALRTTNVPLDFSNIIETGPLYDHIFCAGTEALDILKENGVDNARWLPYAFDPECHRPINVSEGDKEQYQRDVAFVGSFYLNRAEILEGLADLNVGVWGPNWRFLRPGMALKKKAIDEKLNYDEWVKIYNLAKEIIVIHFDDKRTPSSQASPKLFEALGCRNFVLVDCQKDALTLFKDGEHLVFFDGKKDLRNKVLQYLDDAEERERIAEAGYLEVMEKHTYKDRMKEIVDIFK